MVPTCQTASSIRHRKPAHRLSSTSAWPSSPRANRFLIAIVHQPARARSDVGGDGPEDRGQVATGGLVVEGSGRRDVLDGVVRVDQRALVADIGLVVAARVLGVGVEA